MSTHSATAQPQSPDMTHIIHKLAFGEKLQVGGPHARPGGIRNIDNVK